MAQDVLVETDIASGRVLLDALRRAGFEVSVAYWLFNPDSEAWRFFVASPEAEAPREASRKIVEVIRTDRERFPNTSRIRFVAPDDPTASALSRVVAPSGKEEFRLSDNMIDGVYVDDAYIYATAA